jgi:hypothetical protein
MNESAQDKMVRLLDEKKAKDKAKALAKEGPRKFVREFFNDKKELTDRWTYNLDKFPHGPIMTENFELPAKEKKSKQKI